MFLIRKFQYNLEILRYPLMISPLIFIVNSAMFEHMPVPVHVRQEKRTPKHHDELADRLTTDPLNDPNVTVPEQC